MTTDPPRLHGLRRVLFILFLGATTWVVTTTSPPLARAGGTSSPDRFCIPGVSELGDDACYSVPDTPSTTLLIYLHGILPPVAESRIKTTFQTIVTAGATRAGVVALMPRGKRGLAPRTTPDWWGWPTTSDQYDVHGATLARRLEDTRRRLEARLGRRFDRVYLAGSSSGAYFVSALALRGGFLADGYGVLSGGAPFYAPGLASLAPRPVYIGYGTLDTVGRSCDRLAAQLRRARWPVQLSSHRTGHGTRDVYLSEAFAFWAAAP